MSVKIVCDYIHAADNSQCPEEVHWRVRLRTKESDSATVNSKYNLESCDLHVGYVVDRLVAVSHDIQDFLDVVVEPLHRD